MVTLVGFAWDSADSKKFLETFRWHKEDFGRLLDLKHTATSFGYPKTLGLGALASHVLGFQLPKCSMVRFPILMNPKAIKSCALLIPSALDVFSALIDCNEADLMADGGCVMADGCTSGVFVRLGGSVPQHRADQVRGHGRLHHRPPHAVPRALALVPVAVPRLQGAPRAPCGAAAAQGPDLPGAFVQEVLHLPRGNCPSQQSKAAPREGRFL